MVKREDKYCFHNFIYSDKFFQSCRLIIRIKSIAYYELVKIISDSYVFAPTQVVTALYGSTATLICNATGENINTFSWSKYNGSSPTLCSTGTVNGGCPSNYAVSFVQFNSTILISSTLTITSVSAGDFAAYSCTSFGGSAFINLTQLYTSI